MHCGGSDLNNMSSVRMREQDSTRKEEDQLWKKCNELLNSDKKLTKFYVASFIIHIFALAFVTLSVSNHKFEGNYVRNYVSFFCTYVYI